MYLLFNMLFRLVITFLPKNKCLLTSWLQSPSAVILEPQKIKSATVSPSICYEVMGPDAMILVSWMLCFKQTLSVSTFTFIVIIINWKLLKEMGIPDHLTCLLRNLYAGQEPVVRTGHGTTDWLQIGKDVWQGCILSACLFNLYAEYIMRKARLNEAQARIKTAGRNINYFRYADAPPLW